MGCVKWLASKYTSLPPYFARSELNFWYIQNVPWNLISFFIFFWLVLNWNIEAFGTPTSWDLALMIMMGLNSLVNILIFDHVIIEKPLSSWILRTRYSSLPYYTMSLKQYSGISARAVLFFHILFFYMALLCRIVRGLNLNFELCL